MWQKLQSGSGGSERCDYGETEVWTATWQEMNLGYKPDFVILYYKDDNNSSMLIMKNDSTISNNVAIGMSYSGSSAQAVYYDRDVVNSESSYKITDKGFAFKDTGLYLGKKLRYYAMKK